MTEPVTGNILLVEDETDQRRLVTDILKNAGYQVTSSESAEAAMAQLQTGQFDLVLSDWRLPGQDGMSLLQHVMQEKPHTAFIMITAYGSISNAVKAIQQGADDYLTKPFAREALLLAIHRVLRQRKLMDENRRLQEAISERDRLVDLVGKAPSMQWVFDRVTKIAPTEAVVLITGESGTGKELTARAIHTLSSRVRGPFVAVNCAAVPEGLLETEFFGAEKGAFTGADRPRKGKFEVAHGGTLFLDEVAELPRSLQPKLLRALQERTLTHVGGHRDIPFDVRLMAATNRDLALEVREGRFREDLYYRLAVVPIPLPPLRERKEDIPILIQHFLDATTRRHRLPPCKIPRHVLRTLINHSWPGNVRELANTIERLLLLSDDGQVRPEDLAFPSHETRATSFTLPAEGIHWEEHERHCLQQALDMSQGNRAQAARLLCLPYKAFLYRLEKHQLA